jgi:hypothetical protein
MLAPVDTLLDMVMDAGMDVWAVGPDAWRRVAPVVFALNAFEVPGVEDMVAAVVPVLRSAT